MSQPSLPQYPGPYPHQPYGDPPQPPAHRGTAVAASVLALVGAAVHLLGVLALFSRIDVVSRSPFALTSLVANVVLAGLLLPGAILLLQRKVAGQVLVATGAGFAVVYFAFMVLAGFAARLSLNGELDSRSVGYSSARVLVVCLPAIVTLVLAVIAPTRRWVRQRRAW
ncbi:hypothetical protein [Prauserella flavalba]|uniref:Uncharacterized protein n=1 Tax=Prauserella flavalba TaxID=1477506 RepID=A0A318LCG8_9PSEU|nr:hypothetical protein [Prauserella flavalba]PXY20627.1 hypothetical protein BA062_32980 [Prauserella flavalba]